ncbi:MAG: glycosyltransferase [Calditrichaeota bacterium]|nr:glycosyltransferase [Calditrichota bacterium]
MTDSCKHIRLLYLTYGENVLESGILRSQVRAMLTEMAKRPEIKYIRLLSFISPRLWIRRRKGYLQLRRELLSKRIDFRVRLMPSAQTWNWLSIPLFTLSCLPVVLSHLAKDGFDIIHARSYAAGLLALISARLLKIRCVFDPRGPFPEEMITDGRWRKNGTTYRIWLFIEKKLIRNSDAIIGVTPQFRREFEIGGAARAVFVPGRADLENYNFSYSLLKDFANTLVFAGESTAAWYKPERIAVHFTRLKKHIPDLKLHLLSRMNPVVVDNIFKKHNVHKSDWTIEACLPEEVPDHIKGSGLGLITGISIENGWTSWPVKYAECLAAGVPVAVEKEIGPHITEAVKRYKLGIVLDEDNPESYRMVVEVLQNRAEYGERCMNYAKLKLTISHSAAQYARLYRELLKG